MPTISLDQIKKDIQKKYEPLTIPFGDGDSVVLTLPLRMPKEQRAALTRMQSDRNEATRQREAAAKAAEEAGQPVPVDEGSEDRTVAYLRQLIVTVAADTGAAQRLIDAIGEDLVVLNEIGEAYGKATQLGEASPSES